MTTNFHVEAGLAEPLYAVKDGPVLHYVRRENPSKSRVGLAGPTLCGKLSPNGSPPKWRVAKKPGSKTCNTCAAEATRVPSRVEWG